MLPSVRVIYPKIIYVVEDNSPVHRAKIVKKWFEEQNDIIRIDWPAISPDLNIIENIWSLVAKEWDNNKKKNKRKFKKSRNQIVGKTSRTKRINGKLF